MPDELGVLLFTAYYNTLYLFKNLPKNLFDFKKERKLEVFYKIYLHQNVSVKRYFMSHLSR